MNSFNELLQNRRSVRQYTEQKIEREKLDLILQAALMSPSSKRCNPWQFVVVDDHEVLSKFASCRTYGSKMLEQASAAVVVAVDASLTDTWQCDGAIAAHNMLLAAADLGLGACWVQVYNREGAEQMIRQELDIPESLNILCMISLGYKNEERKPYDLQKLQYDKIHYERY